GVDLLAAADEIREARDHPAARLGEAAPHERGVEDRGLAELFFGGDDLGRALFAGGLLFGARRALGRLGLGRLGDGLDGRDLLLVRLFFAVLVSNARGGRLELLGLLLRRELVFFFLSAEQEEEQREDCDGDEDVDVVGHGGSAPGARARA